MSVPAPASSSQPLVRLESVRKSFSATARPLQPVQPKATVLTATADGRAVSAGYADGDLKLWDADPKSPSFGEERLHLEGVGHAIVSLAGAPDGRRLAAARADGQAVVWGIGDDNPVTVGLHKNVAFQVDFSADGSQLVSYGSDGSKTTIARWPRIMPLPK